MREKGRGVHRGLFLWIVTQRTTRLPKRSHPSFIRRGALIRLFIFLMRSDAAGGDGFVDDFLGEVAGERVVV